MSYSTSRPNQRHNESQDVDIDTTRVVGSGTFKTVFPGIYKSGERKGQQCVGKVFKRSAADPSSRVAKKQFDAELDVVQRTQRIIDDFEAQGYMQPGRRLALNHHKVVNVCWPKLGPEIICPMMVEPMIENFEKFNSNSGWVQPGHEWLQSLSHWSYHNSEGRYLLCDLQGGKTRDG